MLELSKHRSQITLILALTIFRSSKSISSTDPSYPEHLNFGICSLEMLTFSFKIKNRIRGVSMVYDMNFSDESKS